MNRKEDAIRKVRVASELIPASENALIGADVLYTCASVYVVVGEYDAATEHLEYLISAPTGVSKPLLEIDPIWDPLRDHPRFRKLVG